MKSLKKIALLAGTISMFTSHAAYAGMANGSYYNDFSGEVPVWDISGDYSGDIGLGLGLDFSISEEPSGAFSGGGTFNYDNGSGDYLDGDIDVSGKVSGSATDPKVAMDISISGTGTVVVDQAGDTDDVIFTALAKVNFDLDSADGQLIVTGGSVTVKEKDLTTGKSKSRTVRLGKGDVMNLPGNTTGDWNLTLNLTPNKNKYTGTATIETSTGGTAEFNATGTYSAKTDNSTITLKGADGDLNLVISTSGSALYVHSVKGKLLGQSLNFKAP